MSVHQITAEQWGIELSNHHKNSEQYKRMMGVSANSAGAELNVSVQMISKLLKSGKLDQVQVLDDRGETIATLITLYSIENYRKNRRQGQQVRKAQRSLSL